MGDIDLSQVGELIDLQGATVVGHEDERIGKVDQIWVDNVNGQPEWAAVRTGSLPGGRARLVPLRAADLGDGRVKVNYTKDEVNGAPDFEPGRSGRDDEERLYRHYRQPLPAPPPPQVRNPFDRLTAVWMPGVAEKAAEPGRRARGEA